MHVRLKNPWFPGLDYPKFKPAERRLDTVEIPDELFDRLPKSAEVFEGPIKRVPVDVETADPRADPEALEAHADALADAERKADEQRAKNAAKIKERLEGEVRRAEQLEAEENDRLDAQERHIAEAVAAKEAAKSEVEDDDYEAEPDEDDEDEPATEADDEDQPEE